MYKIPGYTIKSKIFESLNTLVYRGIRQSDERPVILKILKEDYPSPEELVRYRQEYEITSNLDLNGVIKTYGQEKYGNTLAIILEDFGGESLKIHQEQRPFTLTESLQLTARIAKILGDIHVANVIHKDVNPSNIVYNPESDVLKLIDFGISTKLSREVPVLKNPERLEGTLEYMSPEQTGRMNRALDYRTDFYSLGVTLYELLTGSLPFPVQDPLKLTHAHLAREAASPRQVAPEVSENLAQVVLKLLAKKAEDRYQTNPGLIADLNFCLEQPEHDAFTPGEKDVSAVFQLPQKLYGRESELKTLLSTAKLAAEGRSQSLFVAGYSGVGKSALVKELHGTLIRPGGGNGYFISGKFDQYHRNIPYSAPQEAFRDLIRQLLTESEQRLTEWKYKIQKALGSNGRIMTDFLPELEVIIGEQPPVPPLDTAGDAGRNRFALELRKFVNVFLQTKHPLILFLDDLQWADLASLEMIKMMTANSRFLFLLGAYRDNEVNPAHPLLLTQTEMRKDNTALNSITLLPLELADIRRYIADATKRNVSHTEDLANLALQKTAGNPFFLGEFLKAMEREALLTFDERSAGWFWDMKLVQEQNITDNVVVLIAERVRILEKDTKAALSRAACLGNTFDLETLALLHGKTPAETAGDLWPALELNMLLPLRDEYKIAALEPLDFPIHEKETRFIYKFAHDRIEEAGYNLLPQQERELLHLTVGRFLLGATEGQEHTGRIFSIVDHLNLGRKQLRKQAERDLIADLNLNAGSRAQASNAYAAALEYYITGLELLNVPRQDPWDRTYELTLKLTTQGAEAAMLARDYPEMDRLMKIALERAANSLDRAKLYELQIVDAIARNNLSAAVPILFLSLKQLGVHLPKKPGKFRIIAAFFMMQWRLAGKSSKDIMAQPKMQDPRALAASRILEKAANVVYTFRPDLVPAVTFQQLKLSLKYGNTQETPFFYGGYGMILAGAFGRMESAYAYGKLSLQLMEHLAVIDSKAKIMLLFYSVVRHWRKPLQESIQPLLDIHKIALETGDLGFAAISLYIASAISIWSGSELKQLEKDMTLRGESILGLGQKTLLIMFNIELQAVRQLREPVNNPAILAGNAYNEITMLPIHKENQNKGALVLLYLWKLILAYLFQEDPDSPVQNADQAEKYLRAALGSPIIAVFHFYDSLARLSLYSSTSRTEQKAIRKKVKANQKKMKKWAHHAPMNQLHRFYLVAAEEARVLGHPKNARDLYDQAIKEARDNGFINDEALAWELAGRFYLEQGPEYSAHFYLSNARYAYSRWGAIAKVAHLEESYPQIFDSNSSAGNNSSSVSSSGRTAATSLDLAAIVKASGAIAGEMRTDVLIQKLMSVVLENTGAEGGILILAKGDRFYMEARAGVSVELLDSLPLDAELNGSPLLPRSLIAYTIRTKAAMVLEEASNHELFRDDPYIRERKAQSVLCAPILHQQKLSGLFYLENNVLPGIFTADRLEILRLLSAQIAVSLKNALDYEELQKANRTKGLFLSKMSHELRTPLIGILGQGQALLQNDNVSREENLKRAQVIVENGEKLNTFISNILELTRTEGHGPKSLGNFAPVDFFEDILTPFRARAYALGLSFNEQFPPNLLPRELRADQPGLSRLLRNLLDNAVKFTKTGNVTFRASYEEGSLRCEIKDTGPGLTPTQQEQIFSPFLDAKEAVLETQEGTGVTGLGLAASKMLVENMGGSMTLRSEPGRGSVFMVEIPMEAIIPDTGEVVEHKEPAPVSNPDLDSRPENIPGPGPEEARKLHKLASNGDVMGIIEYAEQLERQDPKLKAFTREVSRMAKGFQERKLREFIGEYTD